MDEINNGHLFTVDEEYTVEKECIYKDEQYTVRNNGAIYRHQRQEKPKRKLDCVWSFGNPNPKNYLMFGGEQVHRIVATAFHGKPLKEDYVVDHIDTNRHNNRPENLRWLSKLENILLNELTRRKIEFICGSVEDFLNNPELLRGHEIENPNFEWMRRVTPEEAKLTLKNWKDLLSKPRGNANSSSKSTFNPISNQNISSFATKETKNTIAAGVSGLIERDNKLNTRYSLKRGYRTAYKALDDEYSILQEIKRQETLKTEEERENELIEFITQTRGNKPYYCDWNTPTTCPLCPDNPNSSTALQEYFSKLKIGEVFTENIYCQSIIKNVAFVDNKKIVVKCFMPNSIKDWNVTTVLIYAGCFYHHSVSTYFSEKSADKYFTLEQGKEWTGGEVYDDYC